MLELLDDRLIDDGGPAAKPNDTHDLRRILYRSKTLGQVETTEEVARKQWPHDPPFHAADGLEMFQPWIIRMDTKGLSAIFFGSGFLAGTRVDAEPARCVG